MERKNACYFQFRIFAASTHGMKCKFQHTPFASCCAHSLSSSSKQALQTLAMDNAAADAKPAIAATKAAIVDSLPPDPIAAGLEELSKQHLKLRKGRKDLARQVKNAKKW